MPVKLEEVGRSIAGRYVIEALLGHGGMAAVYRVRDTRNGHEFALKRGIANDPKQIQRRQALLEREYHTLAQLAHPNIVSVHDYGVDDQGPYYVMELLDGADLDRSERMPWREACVLLADVASSLAMLHSRGLVHRDISGRNVRRTADGRAKLIDFGALVSIGVAKDVVGTPPFMAPEALQMQTLDARADLYSLGALGYYLLTGRHAYPARSMKDLRDVWRSRPTPPARRVPEVPVALSDLIVQLLALDRSSRPQSAAEVMAKLCAMAGLSSEAPIGVSRAYLATPTLVGREQALVVIRRRLLSLPRGDGGSLLIEGPPGSGRSRLLDACALEGKLLGAAVVRADASELGRGEFGVIQVLGKQLFELFPTQAREACRLSRGVLGQLFDEIATEEAGSQSLIAPERSLLVRELRDFVIALARAQRIVIAIDDADRIDESSLAVLASLANKAERHPIVLAFSVGDDFSRSSSAANLLRSLADRIELTPLGLDQTAALMRSVFGDVGHLALISDRIHTLAQGNPRTTMELAQHLVSHGLARYEAGHWLLPETLADGDLPANLSAALAARVAALSPDARALCEVLALADGDGLRFEQIATLATAGDAKRAFGAADELVAARVLASDPSGYSFTQRELVSTIREQISAARARELHARLAQLLAQSGGEIVHRVEHLFEAGDDQRALELLCSLDLLEQLPPLALLERAVERAERVPITNRTRFRLRIALLIKANYVPALDVFRHYLPRALEQLDRDSGLVAYARLAGLPESERLSQALAETQRGYLEMPEHERVFAVGEAVTELGRLVALCSAVAIWTVDIDSLEELPALDPLVQLSPALAVLARFRDATKEWIAGRVGRAHLIYREILVRLARPDRGGLAEAQHARVRGGVHLLLGLLEAARGADAAEQHARELEADRMLRVSAWRVRQVLHMSRGDTEEARNCMRRAESLQLQVGGEQHGAGSTFAGELISAARAGDILALRASLERVQSFAERYPKWRPVLLFGQSRLRQLQGDPAGALEILLPGFDLAKPGRHWGFSMLAMTHISVLCELGRVGEAIERGVTYLEIVEREELTIAIGGIHVELALAYVRAGTPEQGLPLIDRAFAIQKADCSGVGVGAICEARARIAIAMQDTATFEHFAERCSVEYGHGKNPALSARLTRLYDEANKRVGTSLRPNIEPEQTSVMVEYATIHSRMRECIDLNDRARCVLTIILQQVESFAGYLYGIREDGLSLLAGLPFNEPESKLDSFVREWAEHEFAAMSMGTVEGGGLTEPVRDRFTDSEGRVFEPILLFTSEPGSERAAAVLVLNARSGQRTLPNRELLSHMAEQLLEHGDVTGITMEQLETAG